MFFPKTKEHNYQRNPKLADGNPTMHIVQWRFEQLPLDAQIVVRVAAVVGMNVRLDVLDRALPPPMRPYLTTILGTLVDSYWLTSRTVRLPHGHRVVYSFRNPAVPLILCENATDNFRGATHLTVAEHLERECNTTDALLRGVAPAAVQAAAGALLWLGLGAAAEAEAEVAGDKEAAGGEAGLATGLAPRESARLAQGSFLCSCSDIMNSNEGDGVRGFGVPRAGAPIDTSTRRHVARRRFQPACTSTPARYYKSRRCGSRPRFSSPAGP